MNLSELREIPYFDQAPKRVISLVPSMTENLFLLGFGSFVVGVTDYCIHPKEKLKGMPRVGGPKDPDIEMIVELSPDLVILNQEESTPQVVKELNESGIRIWITFPTTVDEAIADLHSLLGIFKNDKAAIQIKSLQAALDIVQLSGIDNEKVRCFCPIWMDKFGDINWMMTFNSDTYTDYLLEVCGAKNVFAERKRNYPLGADLGLVDSEDVGDRDTRYPRVTVKEINDQNPQLILLPSEPFKFDQSHVEVLKSVLAETDAVKNDRVILVDGTLLFWPGVRLGLALQILPNLIIS
jgi:ABC-type Fe3+-hydroxamate transport system substrate-binding protein